MQQPERRILPIHIKQHNSSFRELTVRLQVMHALDKVAIIRGLVHNNSIKASPSGRLCFSFVLAGDDIFVKPSPNNN